MLVYTGAATPIRVGFGIASVGFWFWVEMVVDVVFMGDIVINLAFPDCKDDDLLSKPSRPEIRYLKSYRFLIDLVSSIPIEQIISACEARRLASCCSLCLLIMSCCLNPNISCPTVP